MRKPPVILDIAAGSNFLQESQLPPFLKTQGLRVSKTTKIHYTDDIAFCIVGSVKLYVHVGRITELVNFLVCERLAVPAILGCDFCDQFVECNYPKTQLVKLVYASTVAIVRHYGKQ